MLKPMELYFFSRIPCPMLLLLLVPGEAKETFTQWDLNGVQLPGAHGLGPPLPGPAPDLPLP